MLTILALVAVGVTLALGNFGAAPRAYAAATEAGYNLYNNRWRGAPGPPYCCLQLYIYFESSMQSFDRNALRHL